MRTAITPPVWRSALCHCETRAPRLTFAAYLLCTVLSTAYGSLPRQFGGVLPGLPGSFATRGTHCVCTAHSTMQSLVQAGVCIMGSCRHNPASRRQELANDTKQSLILVWLDEIFCSAHLKRLVPMLLTRPRGQHDNG